MMCACLLAACSLPEAPVASEAARARIEAGMKATWDRPDAPLQAGPIVVGQDFAVADWTQGRQGGRALLQRRGEDWETKLCAGDGIRDAAGLMAVGVPEAEAVRLAHQLAEAERQVPAERLALMAGFHGIVRMPASGGGDHAH